MQCVDSIRVVHPLFQEEDGGSIPTSPLQLTIGEISLDKAIELNFLWHSRLPEVSKSNMQRVRHLVCYGAEFNGVYYASAIWTDPIARALNGRNWLELRRLAIADDAPKNTATRVIRIMTMMIRKRLPHIQRLISYQDCDVHEGTIYKAAGWIAEAERKNPVWNCNVRKRKDGPATGDKIRWGKDLIWNTTN